MTGFDHALNKKRTTAHTAAGPQTIHRLGKILIVGGVRDEPPRLQASVQGG
jgi:hypothetical protein